MQKIQEKFANFAVMKELDVIVAPIAEDLRRFEVFFGQALHAETEPMDSIMRYVLESRGKRLRPILTLFFAKLFGEVNERTMRVATAMEVVHSASLVHDDVIDDDDERRGKASVRVRFSNSSAVLAGDYLLTQALLILSHPDSRDLLPEIVGTASAMIEGELMQSSGGQPCSDGVGAYLDIITRKTARLIRSSCVAGAMSVNAPKDALELVADFGINLGIVFQMRDDILDADDPEAFKLAQSLLPSYLEKTLASLDVITATTNNTAILGALTDLAFFCAQRLS